MRRTSTRHGNDESAVSEAISYVLIFGLISLGTAIIYLQGTPTLNTAEERQITQNAERAVFLIQERLDEMVRQNAPTREIPIDVQDFTVGIGGMESGWVNVTAEGAETVSYNASLNPIYVDVGGRTVAYENGAVMVGQQGNNESWGMRRDPSWAISTNDTDYLRSGFVRTISTTGRSDQRTGACQARLRDRVEYEREPQYIRRSEHHRPFATSVGVGQLPQQPQPESQREQSNRKRGYDEPGG